jgi:hypothetical protein
VNRQVIAIVVAGLVVVGGAVGYVVLRPAPEPSTPAPVAEPVVPPEVTAPRRVEPPVEIRPAPRSRSEAEPSGGSAPAPEVARPETPAPVEAAPTMGILHFESDIPGASVFLDREPLGVTPVTAPSVKPGPHRLNVSLPGYDMILETIEVTPGPRDIVINFKEVRLDAKIDVVHKHRFGSCKGTLVATQRGFKYETANKDDAFAVALMEVESLQIDYLEKRLRVVLKGGKRFDFGDPEDNADRLFVFHRDVEKARERLKKGDHAAPE